MMINKRIGAGGAAVLFALSRIFTEASPLPSESTEYGMQRFTVVTLAFLTTFVSYLPLLIVLDRTDGRSPLEAVASRSKLLSGFIGVIFSVFLLFCAAETGLRSYYYTSGTVFDSAPASYFYIFVGAALLFAVYCGLEAVSRTGMIVSALFAALILLIVWSLLREIRTERLYPVLADDPAHLAADTVREFSRSVEYLVFAALCGSITDKRTKAVPIYLGVSCGAILLMTFLYDTVFGKLTSRLIFPFYTLSSISDTALMHRINGIDVIVWVMAGLIRLALFAFAFRAVVRDCFGSEKAAGIAAYVFCATALIMSELFTAYPALYEPMKRICGSGIPLAAIAVILPAAVFVCTGKRKAAAE